jgi:membrane protein
MEARAPAKGPSEFSGRDWREVLKRTYRESSRDNVSIIAAGVAFYAFLAFVPLLGSLVLVYGFVAEPQSVVQHMQALTALMPADAARMIGEQLMSVTQTASSKKGLGLLIALLLSIYGAMRGASSIITALNIVYEVKETRSFLKATMVAAALTVGAVFALLLAMLGISLLGFVEKLLPFSSPAVHLILKIVFWTVAAAAVSLIVALVYRYAPNHEVPKWRWLTPGSIAATVLWLAATLVFGLYVTNFGNYNATYGSLGAVVVFLTWLYLTAYILLMGGELNAELEKQTSCATEEA